MLKVICKQYTNIPTAMLTMTTNTMLHITYTYVYNVTHYIHIFIQCYIS